MHKIVEVIYEKGILRPVTPLKGLKEKQKIRLIMESRKMKAHPLKGLCGILAEDDAEEMRKIIESEFEKVDINGWQNSP